MHTYVLVCISPLLISRLYIFFCVYSLLFLLWHVISLLVGDITLLIPHQFSCTLPVICYQAWSACIGILIRVFVLLPNSKHVHASRVYLLFVHTCWSAKTTYIWVFSSYICIAHSYTINTLAAIYLLSVNVLPIYAWFTINPIIISVCLAVSLLAVSPFAVTKPTFLIEKSFSRGFERSTKNFSIH